MYILGVKCLCRNVNLQKSCSAKLTILCRKDKNYNFHFLNTNNYYNKNNGLFSGMWGG